MTRQAPLSLLAIFALSLPLGCSDEETRPEKATPSRTIDLGSNTVATLSDDGTLVVTRDGEVVLSTATGRPLFARVSDSFNPDGWHDPSATEDAEWETVDIAKVEAESPAPGQLRLTLPDQGAETALVSLALLLDDGFYSGLGEHFDHVDPRGSVKPMHMAVTTANESGTNEAHVPVPFLVSSKGYGVFVASREAGAFRVGAGAEDDVVRATFEGRTLDVTLFFDPDPLAVVASYTRLTGLPRRPPLWALAPMHWRNEWDDAETLLEDADTYRSLHIPASCLWIDNPWQTSYNTSKLDPARFGDTSALMAQIAAKGFRPLAWSTPYLERPSGEPENEAQTLYEEAKSAGYFIKGSDGDVWPAPGCCHQGLGMLDFTNEAARSFWEGVLSNATSSGFAGFKLDYGEDLVPQLLNARLSVVMSDGQTERTARTYPIGYHTTYHRALDAVRDDGFLLGRASAYGGQTVLDAVWPGDLDNGFETMENKKVGGLPAVIVAAQTLSMSGFPVFGSDTGGYRGGMPDREVLLRWSEHTALSMVMQLGGGGDHHNPWLYDAEAGQIYAELARLHMRLVPYLSSLTRAASSDGTPSIRPLALAYPNDIEARAVADSEYLLGPDLLVAPVILGGVTSREVYLPEGTWVSWFDGSHTVGPQTITVSAPLGKPPLFVRAGAVIPLYPEGIDTLVEATEPGIVTLSSRAADVEARVVAASLGSALFEEGSSIEVEDGEAVTVRFTPKAPVMRATLAIDLRASAMGPGATTAKAGGAALTKVADETAVRACASSCYAEVGDTLWLRIEGGAEVVLSR